MSANGLQEVITYVHGQNPPPTFHRGSSSIDGIFASRNFLGVKGGYLEYGDAPGDHRGIWIDIPHSTLLGHAMPNVPPKKTRSLQSKDNMGAKKYKHNVHAAFEKQGIYGRILSLQENANNSLSGKQQQEYNEIDRKMETIKKLMAEKSKSKRAGGRQWSDKLQQARADIHVWWLVSRRLQGHRVHSRTIIRAKKKTKIRNTNVDLPTAIQHLDRVHRHYKTIRKHDIAHREAFQIKLAQARAKEGNHKVATIIKTQRIQEAQRRTARRIKWTFKSNARCGTTMIQVKRNGRVHDVTDQKEMESLIIKENQKKYHQTEEHCPLLKGQLLEDIGILGEGTAVDKILSGTYTCPEGTSDITKLWINTLFIPNRDTREVQVQSLKQYQRGWKIARESTASGELHFGHFKIEATHDMISWANYVMSNIPRQTGFVPNRWKKGTDIMLLKKEGLFNLEKLRTIVLFESDFNQANKLLGREAMKLALDKGLISEEQFSRPGRSSQDNALNKRLLFDLQRQNKQCYGICSCDLKSCYDRIVHNAAAIALRRVGVRQKDIESMFATIQSMTHTVRTAFGDSDSTYAADDPAFRLPAQGICQGNGAGPSIWSILGSTIFEALHAAGYASTLQYALSQDSYSICGFTYVDDCDLIHTGDTPDEVFEGLQNMLWLWDHLMEVTGAAIAPDKCWWYLIEFQWKQGKSKMVDASGEFELQVRNKHKTIETLKALPCHVAKEMLGIFLAPNGSEQDQKRAMKTKATEWGQAALQGCLRPFEVWTALTTGILKTLEYPLAATSLSKSDIREILSPALGPALNACGISRSFPRAILYAPTSLQGFNLRNLYHHQACRHIKDILDQHWKQSPSHKHIRLTLEAFKLQAGISGALFQSRRNIEWTDTPHLWIHETLKFCQQYNITFSEPGVSAIKSRRLNDVAIMPTLQDMGFTMTTLKAVNRCRVFLQVNLLSDIASGNGRSLHHRVFQRKRIGRRNSFTWPAQGAPTRRDWIAWETTIKHCFQPQTDLRPRLGHWVLTSDEFITEWDFFLNNQNTLIWHQNQEWIYFDRVTNDRGRYYTYNRTTPRRISKTPPRGILWRTTVSLDGDLWHTQGRDYNVTQLELDNLQWHTFPDSAWICTNIQGEENTPYLRDCLSQEGIIAVSDGSYHKSEQIGAAAWTLSSKCGSFKLSGGGITPGNPSSQSAYRSEAAGILGIIIALQVIIGTEEKGEVTIYCDGQGALMTAIERTRYNFGTKDKCFDIISRIIELQESLRHKIIPQHVHGHKDRLTNQFTVPEQLNIEMDSKANKFVSEAIRQEFIPPIQLPEANYGIPIISIQQEGVTSRLEPSLCQFAAHEDAKQWWIKTGRVNAQTWDAINWTTVKQTLSTTTFARKRFIIKWVTNTHPTGMRMKMMRMRESPICPRCLQAEESLSHVIRCPHAHNTRIWQRSLRTFDSKLRRIGTDPDIIRAFTLALLQWRLQDPNQQTLPVHVNNYVLDACKTQNEIGWTQFITGLWSIKWAECQQRHYKYTKKRNSGQRWSSKASSYLWDAIQLHWNHRNSFMYRSETTDDAIGNEELLFACQLELDFGPLDLDEVLHGYFDTDIDTLEDERTQDIIAWFSTIRRAREESGFVYHNHDRISDSLRRRVGLSMDPRYRKDTSST